MDADLTKIKEQAMADFAEFINPMKVRTMKAAKLDIIEQKREGACVWDITGSDSGSPWWERRAICSRAC